MLKPTPKWQSLTGITSENETTMEYALRGKALGRLMQEVDSHFRAELSASRSEEKRFPAWDPIPKVCFMLGIARAKLSRYSREQNGLGIHEFYDAIRIESIKPAIAGKMSAFVRGLGLTRRPECKSVHDVAKQCFLALKRRRREDPAFDRNQWVQEEYNFPNYTRFRKACLAVFQKTPQQLEYAAMLEVAEELWREWAREGQEQTKTSQGAVFFTNSAPPRDSDNRGGYEKREAACLGAPPTWRPERSSN